MEADMTAMFKSQLDRYMNIREIGYESDAGIWY